MVPKVIGVFDIFFIAFKSISEFLLLVCISVIKEGTSLPSVCDISNTLIFLNLGNSKVSRVLIGFPVSESIIGFRVLGSIFSISFVFFIMQGANISIPFSPFCTCLPNFCHVLYPATAVAVGF